MKGMVGNDREHKFYGSTTVGERGQIVIPAEARRDLNITPATKLLVFSGPGGETLIITRAESMAEYIAHAKGLMAQMEEIIKKEDREK
ncbi:MAG: AbrB/MazE/SpoVT family DNA-binding domain-containing protein [Dehalococcoidales bacterium]|nr:AbrB/MazE/SpoVT family DNA-binding domain-containing protein [Dehalococcoidales bacterium]